MNKYLKTALYWFLVSLILIAIWIWTSGCSREEPITEPEQFQVCLTVIVTKGSEIRQKYDANGIAIRMKSGENQILISGYKRDGAIHFDRLETLGHEVVHILNWEYSGRIADPDSDNY